MDFFSFYREIEQVVFPMQAFQVFHFVILGIIGFGIYCILSYYNTLHVDRKRRFQVGMGIYFFVEEMLYTCWLLWRCKVNVLQEILPLQLCSLCAIMAVLCVIFKRKEMRFFCGVIGSFAGFVAIVYPANISGLYSVLSYRTLNFFILHGAFILFGIIQLKEKDIALYKNMKTCTIILAIMSCCIFFVNITLHTDYMFIGVPSSIGFINHIYQFTGMLGFLPVVVLVFILIQCLVLLLYRFYVHKVAKTDYENKCKTLKNI